MRVLFMMVQTWKFLDLSPRGDTKQLSGHANEGTLISDKEEQNQGQNRTCLGCQRAMLKQPAGREHTVFSHLGATLTYQATEPV